MAYEYKVIPAPTRGIKAKGIKTPEDRFAHALETEMNTHAADGWEYLRTDTLPSEQREGLMSKTTVYQNMLVFRRAKRASADVQPAASVRPARPAPQVETVEKPVTVSKPLVAKRDAPKDPDADVAAE